MLRKGRDHVMQFVPRSLVQREMYPKHALIDGNYPARRRRIEQAVQPNFVAVIQPGRPRTRNRHIPAMDPDRCPGPRKAEDRSCCRYKTTPFKPHLKVNVVTRRATTFNPLTRSGCESCKSGLPLLQPLRH